MKSMIILLSLLCLATVQSSNRCLKLIKDGNLECEPVVKSFHRRLIGQWFSKNRSKEGKVNVEQVQELMQKLFSPKNLKKALDEIQLINEAVISCDEELTVWALDQGARMIQKDRKKTTFSTVKRISWLLEELKSYRIGCILLDRQLQLNPDEPDLLPALYAALSHKHYYGLQDFLMKNRDKISDTLLQNCIQFSMHSLCSDIKVYCNCQFKTALQEKCAECYHTTALDFLFCELKRRNLSLNVSVLLASLCQHWINKAKSCLEKDRMHAHFCVMTIFQMIDKYFGIRDEYFQFVDNEQLKDDTKSFKQLCLIASSAAAEERSQSTAVSSFNES